MDRWTQESSPANEPRVSPIEEGVEKEVPPGITVEHLADSEDMLDTPRAQVVQENPQNSRRKTLRLMWADSAQESHGDAQNAECLVRDLAARIGPQVTGAPIPTAVRRQCWSPLNVPIVWGAVGQAQSTPVVDWLTATLTGAPQVEFHGGQIEAVQAVAEGWSSLKAVFRSWGILEVDDLTIWLRRQGFVGAQPGNHIAARAQEFIMHEAARADARVALLEVVFVAVVFHVANRVGPSVARPGLTTHRTLGARSQTSAAGMPPGTWEQLDHMHVEDLFLMKIPMLRSCPKFLRRRLREGFACALRERFRAEQVGDEVGERRAEVVHTDSIDVVASTTEHRVHGKR